MEMSIRSFHVNCLLILLFGFLFVAVDWLPILSARPELEELSVLPSDVIIVLFVELLKLLLSARLERKALDE